MIPGLELADADVDLPWPYTPTAGVYVPGGLRDGQNLYASQAERDDHMVQRSAEAMEIDYQRGEDERGEHFIVAKADLEMQQAVPAYLSMSTAVTLEDVREGDIGCEMSLKMGDEPVNSEAIEFYDSHGYASGSENRQVSKMLQLAAGETDLEAAVFCPPNSSTRPAIEHVSVDLIYGASELPVEVVEQDKVDEVAEVPEGDGDEAAARGVIWSGSAQTPLSDTKPSVGDLAARLELVQNMGQHLDFRGVTHNRHAAIKTHFRPRQPGVYRFAAETRSNICHQRSHRFYDAEEGSIRFAECDDYAGVYRLRQSIFRQTVTRAGLSRSP